MLQEKEKARLRKAKEKARIKAQQKISNAAEGEQHKPNKANHHDIRDNVSQYPPPAENIALSIDPTWNMRQRHQELPHRSQNSIPITDLGMLLKYWLLCVINFKLSITCLSFA